MAHLINQVIEGLVAGFAAGLTGWAIDLALGATFEAFGTIIPIIALLGVIYAIVSFVIGVTEGASAGFFFSIGTIIAGYLAHDIATSISGTLSIAMYIYVAYRGESSGLDQSRK